MWRGNPALTAVLFGLPLGFFALICYSICCADIMDADDEDEDDEGKDCRLFIDCTHKTFLWSASIFYQAKFTS